MVTRGQLLDRGAVVPTNPVSIWDLELDGMVYRVRPSENGNGWYLGDCDDSDNLVMDPRVLNSGNHFRTVFVEE